MENFNQNHYVSIEKALKGVGYKVDKIQKYEKKTVITVLYCEAREITIVSPEKQRANDE